MAAHFKLNDFIVISTAELSVANYIGLLLLLLLLLSLLLHDSVLGLKAVDSARKYTRNWTVIIVRMWDGEAWTGLIWLRIGTGGVILWNGS
jgi:hypothetical protein